jgi:hypothetical protein
MTLNYNKDIRGVYIVTTNSNPLMVRAEPNTDGTVIAEIPKGGKCICLGCYSGDWYGVTYENNGIISTGFSHKNYLRRDYKI